MSIPGIPITLGQRQMRLYPPEWIVIGPLLIADPIVGG
jgi:hypothetical protein